MIEQSLLKIQDILICCFIVHVCCACLWWWNIDPVNLMPSVSTSRHIDRLLSPPKMTKHDSPPKRPSSTFQKTACLTTGSLFHGLWNNPQYLGSISSQKKHETTVWGFEFFSHQFHQDLLVGRVWYMATGFTPKKIRIIAQDLPTAPAIPRGQSGHPF